MEFPVPPVGARTERTFIWKCALATTSLTAVAGLVVAVQQLVMKFLWDQSAHTRTLGGLLYMLLGILGLCLPVMMFRYRQRFMSLEPARQWLLAAGLPLGYVLAFAACMEASMRSTTLILARPFTPTAVVRFDPGKSRVDFRGAWRPTLESGSSDTQVERGAEHFSAHLYQGFLRHSRHKTITITGRAEQLDDGDVRITLDVDAQEPLRFEVENLENMTLERDGRPAATTDAQSGKFQLIILGSPKEGG